MQIIIIITSILYALNKRHKGVCCNTNTMAYTHLSVGTKTDFSICLKMVCVKGVNANGVYDGCECRWCVWRV